MQRRATPLCFLLLLLATTSTSGITCPTLADFPRSSDELIQTISTAVAKHRKQHLQVRSQSIGQTHMGKDIMVYTLHADPGPQPRHILLFAGMHAREWITVASTACLLLEKVRSSSFEANGVVLHVLPLLNPDGYDHSQSSAQARHWRKNLNGAGVDLNRNFGTENVTWGFGNRLNQQSELYQGPRPFSERESVALKGFVATLPERSVVLDVHCCARVVFPPLFVDANGEIRDVPQEIARVGTALARSMNSALPKFITKRYSLRLRETEFSASNTGVAVDWIFSQRNIDYAYMLEVRGKRFPKSFRELFHNSRLDIAPVATELDMAVKQIIQVIQRQKQASSREISYNLTVFKKEEDKVEASVETDLRPQLSSGRLRARLAEYQTLARMSLGLNCIGLTALLVYHRITPM